MKSRNLLLGVIILIMGVIALLVTLDVIEFSWRIALRLWPMLLIFAGIWVLPVKEVVKAALLVAAFALGAMLYENEMESQKDTSQCRQQSVAERVEASFI